MGNTTDNTTQATAASRDDRNNITTKATAVIRNETRKTTHSMLTNNPTIRQLTTAQHSTATYSMEHVPHQRRPRGFGRGRLSSGSPGYTSPGNRDLSESPVEGIPRDTLDDAIASSTGNSLQLTSDEALTDAPDSGSVRSIQSRLGQFAYTCSSQDTMDHE